MERSWAHSMYFSIRLVTCLPNPGAPALAVLPTRWRWSIVEAANSSCITCSTSLKSMPRAARSVQIKIGALPSLVCSCLVCCLTESRLSYLNFCNAISRTGCGMSLWKQRDFTPSFANNAFEIPKRWTICAFNCMEVYLHIFGTIHTIYKYQCPFCGTFLKEIHKFFGTIGGIFVGMPTLLQVGYLMMQQVRINIQHVCNKTQL